MSRRYLPVLILLLAAGWLAWAAPGENRKAAADKWRAALKGIVRKLPADDAAAAAAPQRYYGVSEAALREAGSVRQVGDLLGDVPGAGRFGFGYVAGVMIGMMVVVGPVGRTRFRL